MCPPPHRRLNNQYKSLVLSFTFFVVSHNTTQHNNDVPAEFSNTSSNSSSQHFSSGTITHTLMLQLGNLIHSYVFFLLIIEACYFSFTSKRYHFLHCQSCPRTFCFFNISRLVLFSFGSLQAELTVAINV